MTTPLSFGITEAAAHVGLDPTTIRAAIDRREIPAKRHGRRILVKVADLEAWFDALDDARPEAS